MIEMLSIVFFAFVVYTFLVIVPTLVEKFSSEDYKNSYFSYLASKHINSYGK